MPEEIVFTFEPKTGKVEVVIKGVKGKGCKPISEAGGAAIGTIVEHKETAEMYACEPAKAGTKLKTGGK